MTSLVEEQHAFLLDVAKLIQFASSKGFIITGGELYRTEAQQRLYIKQGKSTTKASNHLRRCAIDLNFFYNGSLTYSMELLNPIGDFWESLNPKNSWGGHWKTFVDMPHFERRP